MSGIITKKLRLGLGIVKNALHQGCLNTNNSTVNYNT